MVIRCPALGQKVSPFTLQAEDVETSLAIRYKKGNPVYAQTKPIESISPIGHKEAYPMIVEVEDELYTIICPAHVTRRV